MTAVLGWAISASSAMPTSYFVLLLAGLFVLSLASLGWAAPDTLERAPAPVRSGAEPERGAERSRSLQKVLLIRNEIDEATNAVRRGIGPWQVHDHVDDNRIAHQNELAAIPAADDAFRLASIAWEGFGRYNDALKRRENLSNETLNQIVNDGKRAVDALCVVIDYLRKDATQS